MSWATIEQVTDQTGVTVDQPALNVASAIIDTYAGVSEDMPEESISARDRGILRKATAWQAAWQGNQPGHVTHRGVDYAPSADGVSSQRRSQAEQDLAPLALRELRNLSWNSSRVRQLRDVRPLYPKGHMIDFLRD